MSILETLKERSPALLGELTRRFSVADAAEVAELYLLAEQQGDASFEPDLIREEGVNFNPRAARVLQLILEDPSATPEDLKLALSCLSRKNLSAFADYNTQAERLKIFFENSYAKAPYAAALNFSECLVLLAISLDDMRHLHMRDLSLAKKQAEASLLGQRNRLIAEHFKLETFPKLKVKCESQERRLSRMFEAPNT